ncbi:MAG: methyltransferase [Chloroflexota bacterium]
MPIIQLTNKPLRARPATDYYPTTLETALGTLYYLQTRHRIGRGVIRHGNRQFRVLDPGAGDGVWGNAARTLWPDAHITGVELDPQRKAHPAYDEWHNQDFLVFAQNYTATPAYQPYDIVIGNPPFKLAESFVADGLRLLRSDSSSSLVFLLRLEFLASSRRKVGLFATHRPNKAHVMSRRPSFSGDGKTNALDYMILQWTPGKKANETHLAWYDYRQAYRQYLEGVSHRATRPTEGRCSTDLHTVLIAGDCA